MSTLEERWLAIVWTGGKKGVSMRRKKGNPTRARHKEKTNPQRGGERHPTHPAWEDAIVGKKGASSMETGRSAFVQKWEGGKEGKASASRKEARTSLLEQNKRLMLKLI